jgi:hypothetical protein
MRYGARALWMAALVAPASVYADGFVGVGGGVIHSDGRVVHGAIALAHGIELNYSAWNDGSSTDAFGLAYRFANGSPVSVVLGVSYVGKITRNLLRHEDAYVEVRVELYPNIACQIGHYSTVGDDKGENFLLCGWRWGRRSATVFGG